MVDEAVTPLGSLYAARGVMKLKRAADNQFQKIVRDWEALHGQRKDKQIQKVQTPRHHDYIFSTNAPAAASECIRGYYEDLFNSRQWTKEEIPTMVPNVSEIPHRRLKTLGKTPYPYQH